MFLTSVFNLIIVLFTNLALADALGEGWVRGTLVIESPGSVEISAQPLDGELAGRFTVDLRFQSKETELALAKFEIEVHMPVFGSAPEAIEGARLAILSDIVRFEEAGLPLGKLPEGFLIVNARAAPKLGTRGLQLLKRLGAMNLNIENGTPVSMRFDNWDILHQVKLLPKIPGKNIASYVPAEIKLSRRLQNANFDALQLDDIREVERGLRELLSRSGSPYFALRRIATIAEDLTHKLRQFHEGRLLIFYETSENKAENESYWNKKERLDALEKLVANFQDLRNASITRSCQNRLMDAS